MFLLVTVIVLSLFILKFRREALWLAISGLGAYIISNGFKIIIREPRPPLSLLTDWSFPSGHVLSYVACFGFLFYIIYKLPRKFFFKNIFLAILFGLIILVGPFRVYLGEHWIGDVLAGYILGGVWLAIIIRLYTINLK